MTNIVNGQNGLTQAMSSKWISSKIHDKIYDVNYFTDIKSDYSDITPSLGFDLGVCKICWGTVRRLMLANVQLKKNTSTLKSKSFPAHSCLDGNDSSEARQKENLISSVCIVCFGSSTSFLLLWLSFFSMFTASIWLRNDRLLVFSITCWYGDTALLPITTWPWEDNTHQGGAANC